MALLAHYRRFWFLVVLAALALPMLIQMMSPRQSTSEREARTLAALPIWPHAWRHWLALPHNVEKFLGDHFGLREPLVRANAVLRHALASPPIRA